MGKITLRRFCQILSIFTKHRKYGNHNRTHPGPFLYEPPVEKKYWPRRWFELSAWLNTTDWRARAYMTYFCKTSHWNWKIIMSSVLCSSVVECGTAMLKAPSSNPPQRVFLKVRRKIRHVLRCQMRSHDWVSNGIEEAFGWVSNIKNIRRLTVQYQKIMDR